MARARRMTAAERDAQRATVVELRSGMPAQVGRPMMNPEDQSHWFVITGEDPEGHPRTIILWRDTDLVHGKVVRRVVITVDATLRTATILTQGEAVEVAQAILAAAR